MNLYDKLSYAPLFQGMTNEDLMQIIGQTKFAFRTFAPGDIIRKNGEPCMSMAFLIGGNVSVTTYADDYGYSVEESLGSPAVLQPERLFGLTQRYTHTFAAETQCDLMEIGKDDVMRLSDEFVIFRLNLMNIVSTVAQKAERTLWQPVPCDVRAKIVRFFMCHCVSPVGRKVVRVKMTRLAQEIGEGRLAVSGVLNEMKREGAICFSRGIITVNALECLSIMR